MERQHELRSQASAMLEVLLPAIQLPVEAAPFQEWNGTGSKASARFFRLERGLLARFPDVADFLLNPAGTGVTCIPVPGERVLWRSVYEQQVRPLMLSLRGEQVYHGGAVCHGGGAIAFLGPSGIGKSTLTTALAIRGHAFLGDDCLHFTRDDAGGGTEVLVHPQAPSIRLWEDSVATLAPCQDAAVRQSGSPKPRLLAGIELPHCDVATPLRRVYVLGDGSAREPRITPIAPAEMLMAWTANAFVMDIKSPDVLRRNLEFASGLVARIPSRRLDYPRVYEELDALVQCILADAADPSGAS